MKKSLVLAMAMTITTIVYAGSTDRNFFIGTEFGSEKLQTQGEILGRITENTDSGAYFGFKAGKYINQNNRVYANLNFYNTEGDSTYRELGMNYDYLFSTSNSKISPFIGVNAGYYKYEEDGLVAVGYDQNSISVSGATFGAQFGIQYSVNRNFDIEAKFSYNVNSGEDTLTVTSGGTTVPITFSFDYVSHIGITANYNF